MPDAEQRLRNTLAELREASLLYREGKRHVALRHVDAVIVGLKSIRDEIAAEMQAGPKTEFEDPTEVVMARHLQATGDLDRFIADIADDALFIGPDGAFRGKPQIRAFFKAFWENAPAFIESFQATREEIHGDFAYITYTAEPVVSRGTETYLIRDGKIVVQTFFACA